MSRLFKSEFLKIKLSSVLLSLTSAFSMVQAQEESTPGSTPSDPAIMSAPSPSAETNISSNSAPSIEISVTPSPESASSITNEVAIPTKTNAPIPRLSIYRERHLGRMERQLAGFSSSAEKLIGEIQALSPMLSGSEGLIAQEGAKESLLQKSKELDATLASLNQIGSSLRQLKGYRLTTESGQSPDLLSLEFQKRKQFIAEQTELRDSLLAQSKTSEEKQAELLKSIDVIETRAAKIRSELAENSSADMLLLLTYYYSGLAETGDISKEVDSLNQRAANLRTQLAGISENKESQLDQLTTFQEFLRTSRSEMDAAVPPAPLAISAREKKMLEEKKTAETMKRNAEDAALLEKKAQIISTWVKNSRLILQDLTSTEANAKIAQEKLASLKGEHRALIKTQTDPRASADRISEALLIDHYHNTRGQEQAMEAKQDELKKNEEQQLADREKQAPYLAIDLKKARERAKEKFMNHLRTSMTPTEEYDPVTGFEKAQNEFTTIAISEVDGVHKKYQTLSRGLTDRHASLESELAALKVNFLETKDQLYKNPERDHRIYGAKQLDLAEAERSRLYAIQVAEKNHHQDLATRIKMTEDALTPAESALQIFDTLQKVATGQMTNIGSEKITGIPLPLTESTNLLDSVDPLDQFESSQGDQK